MRPARLHAFPAVPVPPAKHPIAAATDQYRANRTPGHCIHDPRMPRQDSITCPPGRVALQASHLPHEQLLVVSAPSARGEPLPITAPGHVVHFALMSWELLEQSPVRGVPHRDDAIITGTGKPRPVWTPGHPAGRGWLFAGDPLAGAGGHLPHLYLLPIVSTSQPLSVRTPRDAIEGGVGVVGVPHHVHAGSCGRVPYLDGIIQSTTRQPPPIGTPFHPKHEVAMALEQSGWCQVLHIPDGHQAIRATAGELSASGTPGEVIERDRVALQDLLTLSPFRFPHP